MDRTYNVFDLRRAHSRAGKSVGEVVGTDQERSYGRRGDGLN
jgi:hypothetical protein